MNYSLFFSYLLRFCLLFFIALPVTAQNSTGSISGKIQSETGEPLAQIHISLEGASLGTYTNEGGEFTIKNIPPGTYTLVATGVGYEARKQNIEVTQDKAPYLPLQLNAATQVLEEITVTAAGESYTIKKASQSLKIPTPLLQTPQQVVVITRQLLQDQQILHTQDVARNVSGVSNSGQFTQALDIDFSIRGFDVNKYRNGMLIPGEDIAADPVLIDHIEFIKGPSGFFVGQGAPGGAVNFVTKKPVEETLAHASLTYGSFNTFRGAIDLGGRLYNKSKFSYRLNAMAQNAGHYVRNAGTDKYVVAPALKYQLSENTALTAEYNLAILRFDNIYQPSLVINNQFFTLPRNFSYHHYQEPGTQSQDHYASFTVEHQLNETWKITGIAGISNSAIKGSRYVSNRFVPVQSALDTFEVIRNYRDAQGRAVVGQLFVTGSFNTGNVAHQLLAGFDATRSENSIINLRFRSPEQIIKIVPANPVFADSPPAYQVNVSYPQFIISNNWAAAYVYDNIYVTPDLILNLGGRFTSFHSGDNFNGEGLKLEQTTAFNPRVGITYLPVDHISVYGLYDQGFEVNAGVDREGKRFEPSRGNNFEIGTKGEWFKGKLTTTFSLFNITKTNVLTQDPVNADFGRASGEIRSRGVELDILGTINKNVSIIANYAYIDAITTKDTDEENVGRRANMIPEHTANVWIKYRFTGGLLDGFGMAAGSRTEKGRVNGFTSERNLLPDYTIFDAGLFYQKANINFILNMGNLTDERYALYGQGSPWINVFEGPGRNFRATFAINF